MRGLGWRLVNALQLVYTLSWTAGWITAALFVSTITRHPGRGLGMARRIWAPGLLWGAGARLEVEGLDLMEPHRPYLVVANHLSMMDVPVLFRALSRPLRFVAKRELGRLPFLGWYMRAMGMVLVERHVAAAARASVDETATHLEAGETVVSFPEGTRGSPHQMHPFKTGGFEAAITARVAVLPVAIAGSASVLPPGGFAVRPGLIRVKVGEPIHPDSVANRGALAQAAEEAVRALCEKLASH